MNYRTAIFLIASVAWLGGCQATVPKHTVRTQPEFIKTGVQPGDKVEVKMKDGTEIKFVVTAVEEDALVGDEQRVMFYEIESLSKWAWQQPRMPCGDGPVGCSIPKGVMAVSEYHAKYAKRFHDACVEHDFCYRYGHATYGYERWSCDDEFYTDLLVECKSQKTTIFDVLEGDIQSEPECLVAAKQMYQAIRHRCLQEGKRELLRVRWTANPGRKRKREVVTSP